MPPISFGGINTGLPPNIVDQLIDAERAPIKTLQATKGKSEAKLKLVQDLQTKVGDIRKSLSDLANVRGFTDMKLTSGDPNILNGAVDPTQASPGSWNIEVMKLPEKAAALTNGFPDKDKTSIGVGYFKFKTPNGEKDVYITKGESTLEKVAEAINRAGVGVQASVLNDRSDTDDPYKLILSSKETGQEKNIDYPTLYFLDGDQDIYFDTDRKGKNGSVKVDGFEFQVSDDKIKDVIPGVTLDLKQASPGHPINVTIKEDREAVGGKIKSFVDGMNSVLGFIQAQNKLDSHSDTSQTLGGDGLLRDVENRLRSLVQNPQYGITGSIHNLNQLGITFTRAGTLELDQKKFDAQMAEKPQDVQAFMVGDGFDTGFIPSVKRTVSTLLDSSYGPLTNRTRGLQTKITQTDQQIDNKEKQLTRKEQQLREKFSRLEETMSRLKAQGGAVAALGGGGGGIANLIQG